jgi:hypothetical protein
MTNQDLFALQKFVPPHLSHHVKAKPHFTVSVRFDGPWVTLVSTNYFQTLINGLDMVKTLLEGTDYKLLVERLEQDKDDNCRYNSIILEETVHEQECPD